MAKRIGTILKDMGFLDEEGLMTVLEEQKGSGEELFGKVAVRLGLATEEQVLKGLGEQFGMKVVRLADLNVPPELTELVNETMAQAFKVVPISQGKKDKSVTVAMAEPQNPATLDSLKSFLGVEVKGADRLREGGPGQDRADLRRQGRVDPGRRQPDRQRQGAQPVLQPQREHDRPGGHRGDGRGRAGPQAAEHGAAAGDQGQGLGRPLRAVRGRVQDAVPGRRRALRARPAARGTWRRRSPAGSRSCPTWTSPSGGCRRTGGSS